jgi:hypothetical protein
VIPLRDADPSHRASFVAPACVVAELAIGRLLRGPCTGPPRPATVG